MIRNVKGGGAGLGRGGGRANRSRGAGGGVAGRQERWLLRTHGGPLRVDLVAPFRLDASAGVEVPADRPRPALARLGSVSMLPVAADARALLALPRKLRISPAELWARIWGLAVAHNLAGPLPDTAVLVESPGRARQTPDLAGFRQLLPVLLEEGDDARAVGFAASPPRRATREGPRCPSALPCGRRQWACGLLLTPPSASDGAAGARADSHVAPRFVHASSAVGGLQLVVSAPAPQGSHPCAHVVCPLAAAPGTH